MAGARFPNFFRDSGEAGIHMKKLFKLDLDFTFLRQAFQEKWQIEYCNLIATIGRYVGVAELHGSRRAVSAPYKWVPLNKVKVTHPKKEVCYAI